MEEGAEEEPQQSRKKRLLNFYDKEYRKLLIIPMVLLVLAMLQIGYQTATTGDFINKGISLKGGITMTVHTGSEVKIEEFEGQLASSFPGKEISVRTLTKTGAFVGYVIEADIGVNDNKGIKSLFRIIESALEIKLAETDYTLEGMGSTLGESFFREVFIAIAIAFVFMSIIVFAYFRTFAPSLAVILSIFSDIVITIAIVNIIGIKVSSAGIAAFLMLIGYSVDTDILLSTKLLKGKVGTVMERLMVAMRTGLTMTVTTIIAVFVALLFAQSEVIRQIMMIILIGLFVDIINTWVQNVAILRIHMEKRHRSGE